MVLDPGSKRFSTIMNEIFGEARQATPESMAKADKYKEQLEAHPQVDSFYLELKIGPPTQILWCSNTEALLGCRRLPNKSLVRRVDTHYLDCTSVLDSNLIA